MKILVAEDNTQGLYLLERYLIGCGHEVWAAANGREALDLCRSLGAPDIVVSDALMPVCDGFELCDAVRRDPQLAGLPFILYTATYTAESDERMALALGADRFVVKPIEPERLLAVINEVVAQVGAAPRRQPVARESRGELLQDYARMVSVKLEDKLAELSRSNEALRASEEAVRQLNERLVATVRRLEVEIEDRRRAEELLRLAQQAGGIGNWECDAIGGLRWSAEALVVLGVAGGAGPATLRELVAWVDPEDRPSAERALLKPDLSSVADLEFRLPVAGGSTRHILLRGASVAPRPGSPTRCLGIVQDITARKEADARRQSLELQLYRSQKMEALGKVAGGVAHDFNNVLTVILCNSELLKLEMARQEVSEEVGTALSLISEAVTQARGVVSQILTFSRRESVERQVLPLGNVLHQALRLVRNTIGRRMEVRAELAEGLMVVANENQIHQVLLNLCTNAAHAVGDTDGSITVRLSPVTLGQERPSALHDLRAGEYARIDVIDTGHGMPPSVVEHIFEPFFTTKPEGEGTGLGLAVVHGIVQSHEGAIAVESAPGEGTTFSIYLPLSLERSTTAVSSVFGPAAAPVPSRRPILVVDDEPSVARVCAQLLERLGYSAVVFSDPLEAREGFARQPDRFDAAIVDFLMPRLTGQDLARAIWSVAPGFPVVLVAGFGVQMDAARARAEGFADLVVKPFTTSTLSSALGRALSKPRRTA